MNLEMINEAYIKLARRCAEAVTYRSPYVEGKQNIVNGWSDKFCMDELVEAKEKFNETMFEEIDFHCLSDADCNYLKFGRWSNKEKSVEIRLIPIELYEVITQKGGLELIDINGDHHIVGEDYIDNEHRGGYLAYGIIPIEYRK